MQKLITRFMPPTTHPAAEAEAQYVGVHIPTARDLFVKQPEEIAYYTLKAARQYDYGGRWNHRLTAWRFVIRYLDPGQALEGAAADDLRQRQLLAKRDQPHSIGGVRRFDVAEELLLDRRSGQTASVKCLFEYERAAEMPADEARRIVRSICDEVAARAASAVGFRMLLVDWIEREVEIVWGAHGQYDAKEWLPQSTCVAILELVFDSEFWAEQFFAQDGMNLLMLDSRLANSAGYLVTERCELDKR
jgi:hypothetical protein